MHLNARWEYDAFQGHRYLFIYQNGEQQTPKGEFIPAAGHRHRDKTRAQMPAKMFPHFPHIMLAVYGPTLVLTQNKETVF